MTTPRNPSAPPCPGVTRDGRPCRFRCRSGSTWCINCDPDPGLAEKRRRNGAVRHPRFVEALTVGCQDFDRAKAPTVTRIMDRLLDIDAELEHIVAETARAVADKLSDPETDPLEAAALLDAKRLLIVQITGAYRARSDALYKAAQVLAGVTKAAPKNPEGTTRDGAPVPGGVSSLESVLNS